MYLPASFHETDPDVLARLIQEESFATLVSLHEGELFGSHVPLLLEGEISSHGELKGKLVGHVARANPQWRTAGGEKVLAIFHGPHAYVSPTWYGGGEAVPTWNSITVHVTGRLRILEEPARVEGILRRMVDVYETGRSPKWSMEEAGGEYLAKLMGGITAFEIEIERVEGKFKLSQNQTDARREGVRRALAGSAREMEREVAAWMGRQTGKSD